MPNPKRCPGVMRRAVPADADEVYELVQTTIRACYASRYSPVVIEAFCRYHSRDAVAADIRDGKVHVLEDGGRIVGTGTLDDGYIGRVYVLREEQGRGCGTQIMDTLEELAAKSCSKVMLDSSEQGRDLYLHRGYVVSKVDVWDIDLGDDVSAEQLSYEVMEKVLR